jgi:hypothetical protein
MAYTPTQYKASINQSINQSQCQACLGCSQYIDRSVTYLQDPMYGTVLDPEPCIIDTTIVLLVLLLLLCWP